MIAHSEGVEAAARLLAPALIGQDPRQIGAMERLMDRAIQGHGYAKAPFDAAFWDLPRPILRTTRLDAHGAAS